MRLLATCLGILATTSCAGKMVHRRVADDKEARGIRYFDVANYDLQVFRRDHLQNGMAVFVPVGEPKAMQLADISSLLEASYSGKLFGSVNFQIDLNADGTLKQAILKNTGKGASGAVDAANAALETVRDLEKTKQQAEIDEIQRQIDLIKKTQELQDLKSPPPPDDQPQP